MNRKPNSRREIALIKGEFVTDGKTFVFHLADTPLSGTGDTADSAFQDLMRAEGSAGDLSERLRELARDQQAEKVRATVIRTSMVGLIAFGIVGGVLYGAAAMLPHVAAELTEGAMARFVKWVDNMPPQTEDKVSRFLERAGRLIRSSDRGCSPPSNLPAETPP